MAPNGRTEEVAVLTKAMAVVSLLAAEGPCTVVRICEATGMTKPSAYRILKTFELGGYVIRNDEQREYSIGPALYGISRSLRSSNDLLQLARPVMQSLNEELGETVNIGVVNNGRVVYLDSIESAQRLRSTVQIAFRDHVHSTALGKSILARMPQDEARRLLEQVDRPALTPNTVTSVDDLMAQIDAYRAQGFAVDDEENEVGSRCVASAIVDPSGIPVAAISVTVPTPRMSARVLTSTGKRLSKVTIELGRHLS
jgi:IclR family acetate operon transcriptional repressor